ncbi:bifunctional epoxide hydrolase 2, partial [Notothenia coriiceps]|uniref:Bifunctional epoxide hydrolase 2 n=1 Tax=Notothenia coriiceps TaxID=8208 RepID=A0A6I9P1K1_9TELE
SGLLTAVLANHWLDDSAAGDGPAHLLSLLGGRFDLVLQSCRSGHMVPEPAMFRCALKHLGVTSQQAVWLDADEEGVKAAEGVGMKAILVENLDDALKKLAHFTGVQADGAESPPPSCSPEEVSHGFVTIRPGVRTHFVEMGSGPPVLLCHGFPESWFSWRFQIPAMAGPLGFKVRALDQWIYITFIGQTWGVKRCHSVTLVDTDWAAGSVRCVGPVSYNPPGVIHICFSMQIPDLKRGHIEECGHWIQMERPAETNRILISWLSETLK